MSDVLLPGNTTPQERALEQATARVGSVGVSGISQQWDPLTCPASLLPWLAWAFSVDEWDATWPDEFKRRTIAESVSIHQRKGTVSSVRRVLQNAGYGDATLIEGIYGALYDGTNSHDGTITHGESSAWAEYRVILARPMTNAQAAQVRRLLSYTAPARCDLVQIIYTSVAHTYNGAINYDGTFNHGAA